MDEVDGNSRDTSTDGSSGSFPHSRPEPLLSNYEPLPQHHRTWSPSQPPGDMTHSQQLRGPNISCPGERTDVDRSNLNYGPTVVSGSLNQFGTQLAQKQRTVSHSTSVKHDGQRNHDRNSLTNFPARIGGEETKLRETSLPLRRQSPADLTTGFLLREDEHLHSGMCRPPLYSRNGLALELRTNYPGSGGVDTKLQETSLSLCRQSSRDLQTGFLLREDEHLHSGMFQPPPDSRNGLTFELRSDLNSQNDKDLDLNNFLSKLENEASLLSLRQVSHPPQQVDLREHLPKPDPSALRENSDWNARMHGASAFERSLMSRSVVQQCSDVNDFESYRQVYGDPIEGLGNSLPIEMRQGYIGAGHLERIIREQDELLRSRDQELLQLKEANHRQSLFIEKVLNEKRLLETAVVEQARHLMSQGAQRSSAEPVRPGVSGSVRAFDSKLYETQLATYKEDFENERKEKLLLKGSNDSLNEQLKTALNELRMAQDKLRKTEEELERIRNPYRAAYQPYLQPLSNHSNNTASSSVWSSQSTVVAAQSKTPLYRKPADLEPDRASQTILATLTQMDHMNKMAPGHTAKVDQSNSTTPDQPSRTELSNPSHLWQKSQSGTAKRPPGQEYQINQSEMKDYDLVNQIKAICLTRQGPSNCIIHPECQIHLSKVPQKYVVV